jgi:hypothetical protein
VTTGTALALPQPAIFVVARVAHATLGTVERVAFLRGLGRGAGTDLGPWHEHAAEA